MNRLTQSSTTEQEGEGITDLMVCSFSPASIEILKKLTEDEKKSLMIDIAMFGMQQKGNTERLEVIALTLAQIIDILKEKVMNADIMLNRLIPPEFVHSGTILALREKYKAVPEMQKVLNDFTDKLGDVP